MQRMKLFILRRATSQLLNKFKEGLKKRGKKQQQFVTILHLLQLSWLMFEFEALKSLFSFLNVPLLPKYHQNDSTRWVMVEYIHKQIIKRVKKVITSSKYLALSCDEVTMIHNQSWISIYSYVVQNQCHIFILISFEHVI